MTKNITLSKRGLALFLALVMCLGMLNITAFAADGEQAIRLTPNDTYDLRGEVAGYDNTSEYVLEWSTSDGSVVTVEDGIVTAVGAGTATVTCEVTLTQEAAAAMIEGSAMTNDPADGAETPDTVQKDEAGDVETNEPNTSGENVTVPDEEMTTPDEGATTPAEGTTGSAEGTANPAEGTANPAEGTANPAEGTANPAEGTANPAEGTANPAEGTANPAEGTANPAEGTANPAEGTANPAEGTANPAEGTANPAEGTTAPAEGTTAPAEGTTSGDEPSGPEAVSYNVRMATLTWTFEVNETQGNEVSTAEGLQEALDNAKEGDVLTLASDISGNFTIEGKTLTLNLNDYTISSGVVGQNVITVLGGTVTIENGVITGGSYEKTNQDGKGLLVSNANVTVKNCEIKDNEGYGKKGTTPGYDESYGGSGGGIYAVNSTLTVEQCIVSGNKAGREGGGIYGKDSTVTISGDTKLLNNSCNGGNVGGAGIAMNGGKLNIDGAAIRDNLSTGNRRGQAIGLTGTVDVTIKNAEISSSYDGGDASVIYAQYGSGPINLDLENVDVVNKAGANALYMIYSAVAGTFTAKNCTFHDSNGSIYLSKATEISFTDCKFLDNDATYRTAYAPVYLLGASNASFTGCTFTGNKGYNAGGIYNTTTGSVTIDGCLFTQNSATNSSSAGAIYASKGSTTVTNTVVKGNTTSGTNSSGPAGGISVNGSGTVFTMTSGAVYDNKSEKQSSPAHDIYVYSSAKANILAAKDMADDGRNFSNYTWSDLTRTVIEGELTQSGSWTANNTPEYVATIGETQYKTLDDAFEAARLQSRKTGENVTVEVVEGYVPLNTYWGVSQKAADGPYAPSVTFHLNNTNIYGVGITNSFSVGEGSTLTLSGTGTLNKNILMMGGTLNIDGNVVVSGSTFDFNKGPIYDNKTSSTKVNINGDVDKVQVALYSGTVTVGENAHVGKLEAKMTTSSGSVLPTNFVMNGSVDELVLSQSTGKSTATLNGTIGSLNLKLSTEIYGEKTFPTTKAGENFSVGELSISPYLSSATSFDEETGRTSDGLVSVAALSDPAQSVADLILIQGGGGKVEKADWTTSYSLSYEGKNYKFLTTVESVDGNIVLHKTAVNGNYVLLDGVNGNDSNDGLSLDKPVKTFEKAKEIANDKGIDTIHVLGTVTITGNKTWELDGKAIESFPTFNGTMVKVPNNASLTLKNITLDGQGITRDVPLVENRGSLTIQDGAKLTGGVNKVIYSPNNGQGIDGGAVYNSGTLTMEGGEISDNSARTGGGVFSKGTFEMTGGKIIGNRGYDLKRFKVPMGGSLTMNSAPAGGGVFLASTSKMTLSGGEISNNISCVGGGISLGNETNAYISYGGPKLVMNGGIIDGNSAGQGGGIFIQKQCEATISGGYITNNRATGDYSVATGYQFLYGGGGIYVNGNMDGKTPDGKLYMQAPVITGNTASRYGGGIAGCPSANVDLKVDDSGIIAGNTVKGNPYDVYVELNPIYQPDGSMHKGGRFYLSKYMAGGVLYNWTYQGTNERVPMQDVYSYDVKSDPTKRGGFYADVDSAVIQAVAEKCNGVVISGNNSSSSGGGIGTNGEVNIGQDPASDDFFGVKVEKIWKNSDGTEMTKEQQAELKKHIQSITVELYRRVVDETQGKDENWELVDSRLILPDGNGFWTMNREFTKLLKQMNGQKLEYKVVEVASLTGEWAEANGGQIKVESPEIGEESGTVKVEAINQLNLPSLTLKKVVDGNLTQNTFNFNIKFFDENNEILKEIDKELTVQEGKAEVTLLSENELKDIPVGTKFTVTEKAGNWRTSWVVNNADGTVSNTGREATGTLRYGENTVTFTNYEPSTLPISVTKTIAGTKPSSVPNFRFELSSANPEGMTGYVMPEETVLTINGSDFDDGMSVLGRFDSIQFSEANTYKFIVKEVMETQTGWIFDETEWTVVVKVEKGQDGKLEATIWQVNGEKDNTAITFTNTYNPPETPTNPGSSTTSRTVNKVWVGDDENERPAEVTVQLYRNGTAYATVTLNAANNWTYTWSGLNSSYTWTIGEINVPEGYTSTVSQNGNTVTITNTYEEEVPDEDVPQTDIPDEEPPLANLPEEPEIEIPDEEVPLDATPKTGDKSRTGLWASLCALSLGLMAVLLGKKRKGEDA